MASELRAAQSASRSKRRSTRDGSKPTEERKHRRRRKSTAKEESTAHEVRETVVERRSGSDADSSSSDEETVKVDKSRPKKIRVIYVTENGKRVGSSLKERQKKSKDGERSAKKSDEAIKRTRSSRRKSVVDVPKRSVSTKDVSAPPRPTIQRSKTTSSTIPRSTPILSHNTPVRRSSFMGSFFGGPIKPVEPEKLVECLTCMDDVPKSKVAKLKCGHRMCHSCLKRVFRLSITDPQHMPPKCCTADHIPLEHVDKLFDIKFKKTWNRKFQEFSTKNRIYCPARRCGEWIKPSHIHKRDGRKYGECSRCRTKVCCLCNGKWHGSRECPKDEETNKLLDAAKEAGWQRCYSCRTMVELKEGCNHMTCRCTAEFCMICGLKWKTCNCPWFNYDAVEADRLEHMRVPEDVEVGVQPNRLRRPRPVDYQHEMNLRRRQERADEALARRMQRASLVDDDDDDYQGGIGDIHGIGNGAGHFMNQDYVRAAHNILTGRFDQATAAANYVMGVREARAPRRRMTDRYPGPDPTPPVRRQSDREPPPRPAERPAPERRRSDQDNGPDQPRPAVLAGLAGRGGNRVNAWRNHVAQGAPEEGVLSV